MAPSQYKKKPTNINPYILNSYSECPFCYKRTVIKTLIFRAKLVGFEWLRYQGLMARLCCRKISDSIFWLYYFTPSWLAGAMPCPKNVPKEIYKKKRLKQIRDKDVSFILSFIYWVQQAFHVWGSFFLNTLKWWILQLRCQNTLNRFHVCMVRIWYFGLP